MADGKGDYELFLRHELENLHLCPMGQHLSMSDSCFPCYEMASHLRYEKLVQKHQHDLQNASGSGPSVPHGESSQVANLFAEPSRSASGFLSTLSARLHVDSSEAQPSLITGTSRGSLSSVSSEGSGPEHNWAMLVRKLLSSHHGEESESDSESVVSYVKDILMLGRTSVADVAEVPGS